MLDIGVLGKDVRKWMGVGGSPPCQTHRISCLQLRWPPYVACQAMLHPGLVNGPAIVGSSRILVLSWLPFSHLVIIAYSIFE